MKRILIDAIYHGETRVVALDNDKIQSFDYETASKKQIKGNIYLAKIVRVEPSLQAAFVDYGGNRQGFLPFGEIHSDYYSIPVSDRSNEAIESEDKPKDISESLKSIDSTVNLEDLAKQAEKNSDNLVENDNTDLSLDIQSYDEDDKQDSEASNDEDAIDNSDDANAEVREETKSDNIQEQEANEADDDNSANNNLYKRYKIQEVIKKNQIILVQIIKEERGNKGATLTSYISLAGRFCVLIPNTPRQGGVSKKISDIDDRRRIKDIVSKLNVPKNIGVIVRTAGSRRSEAEIIRDYQYLTKLWNSIREHTLKATAPAFIHAESDIIKRFIRDSYDSEVKEILVHGENAYHETRNFVKLLLPTEYNKVKLYRSKIPIYSRFKVEELLSSLYNPIVALKSGAYLVINQTEAMISVDINSGRSTSERNIEETAVRTNLEAANELAWQIKLRDLSGLIVIDFIDMFESRNRHLVEKAMREALRDDRAKTQFGHISSFGLFEMSRQRLGSNYAESHTVACTHCHGMGRIRAPEAVTIAILRAIEHNAGLGDFGQISVKAEINTALYLLNNKRFDLDLIEKSHNLHINIFIDHNIYNSDEFFLDKEKRHDKLDEINNMPLTKLDNIEMDELDIAHINDGLDEIPEKRSRSAYKDNMQNRERDKDRDRDTRDTRDRDTKDKDRDATKDRDTAKDRDLKDRDIANKDDGLSVEYPRKHRNTNRSPNKRRIKNYNSKPQNKGGKDKDPSFLSSLWRRFTK